MNRWTAMSALATLVLALILPGCPEGEQVDVQQSLLDLSMEAREEGLALLREGNAQAARESFHRAYRHGLDAVTVKGDTAMPDLLIGLAELCCQLGRWSPDYLGRAASYSQMAIETGPGWGMPYLNLGFAYEQAGLFSDSLRSYETFFELVPQEEIPPQMLEEIKDKQVRVLFRFAGEILKRDRVGAEGRARAVLERAFALRPVPATAPQVHQALSDLNSQHVKLIGAAADAGDGLEIVRLHARFGFPAPAESALQKYKNSSGSNRDVRYVEARYVRELAGSAESMRQASEIYLDLLTRGELVVHAAAGYGRTMLALGEGEKALARFADFPNPSAELRRTLILLRLDRITRLPEADTVAADAEFDKIAESMTGGLNVFDRAELYFTMAIAALNRKDIERTEKLIGTYQKRFPQDPRVAILDAELKRMKGIPVEEVFAEVTDD